MRLRPAPALRPPQFQGSALRQADLRLLPLSLQPAAKSPFTCAPRAQVPLSSAPRSFRDVSEGAGRPRRAASPPLAPSGPARRDPQRARPGSVRKTFPSETALAFRKRGPSFTSGDGDD
ncbi:uncharacterized protein LOC144280660 [Canis aureus]